MISQWINITDGCVAAILVLGLLGGIRRGLSGELLRIATIVAALFAGWKGADAGAAWLAGRGGWTAEEVKPLAFFGIIVATFLVLAIVRIAFRLFLDFSFKGKLELIGGAVSGLLRATVFCAIVLLGASLIPSEPLQHALQSSMSGQWVQEHIRPRFDRLIEENPEFSLPALRGDEPEPGGLDQPAWENYLGPLIDPDNDTWE